MTIDPDEVKVYKLSELPQNIAREIMQSTMDAKHNHLNSLLDGKPRC